MFSCLHWWIKWVENDFQMNKKRFTWVKIDINKVKLNSNKNKLNQMRSNQIKWGKLNHISKKLNLNE